MKVLSGYTKKDSNTILHKVVFDKETFEDVPNIPKYSKCSSSNCKYYYACSSNDGVVRKADCVKSKKRNQIIFTAITTAIVALVAILVYKYLNLGFWRGTGILIGFLVVFDIICYFGEKIVEKVGELRFYRYLKKQKENNQKKEEERKALEEKKKSLEEYRNRTNKMYSTKIQDATNSVNLLRELSDNIDFGEKNNKKIVACVQKFEEIAVRIQKEGIAYPKVRKLFEVYLYEFNKTLDYYSSFKKENIANSIHEETITQCVDNFYNYLMNYKIEDVFDRELAEKDFNETANSFNSRFGKKRR